MRRRASEIPNVTQDRLRQLLDYDPLSGEFRWRTRPLEEFADRARGVIWNARFPGTTAGTPHPKGYVQISIDGKVYLAHRLAWLHVHGEWPDKIDHEFGVKTDNRISELRSVSGAANQKNHALHRNSRSGVMGVRFEPQFGKWVARITVNYHQMHLGVFVRKADAIAARKAAERAHGFHRGHGRARSQDR